MKRQVGAAICVVLLGMGAMASCSDSKGNEAGTDTTVSGADTSAATTSDGSPDVALTHDEIVARLSQDGQSMPVETATCIADGLEGAGVTIYKVQQVSPADEEKIAEVFQECGIPLDSDSSTTTGS